MENAEIGTINKTYLSKGELMVVERIAAKRKRTEKELGFIMAMASRSKAKPKVIHLMDNVVIQKCGLYFSVMNRSN